ncbi:MAG: hypothetical protein KDA99_25295, partial [Planctomycetales bacterium]|nr:hypothetical protein [Planctomycetales bacterium]
GKVEVEAANGVKVFETEPNDGVNAGRFSVTEGSVYFLRVRAQGKTAGTYQVSLQSGDVLPPTDPAPVLPSDVTEVESNDSKAAANAFVIAADGTARLNGHIDSADDRDFFAFRADKTGNIDADIIAVGGLTADIEVETEASVKVFETDANDGITSGSFPVTEGQRYFVRVRGKNDSIGSYIVNLAYAGSGGGGTSSSGTNGDSTGGPSGLPTGMIVEVENNNTESLANVFALDGNGRAVLSGVSINDNDKDFFAVTPTASGTLRFDVASPNGEHAQLQVTNRLGAKLFETDPNDGRNSGQVQVTAGEKIYVRLRAKDDAAAEYAVDVAFAELGQ